MKITMDDVFQVIVEKVSAANLEELQYERDQLAGERQKLRDDIDAHKKRVAAQKKKIEKLESDRTYALKQEVSRIQATIIYENGRLQLIREQSTNLKMEINADNKRMSSLLDQLISIQMRIEDEGGQLATPKLKLAKG